MKGNKCIILTLWVCAGSTAWAGVYTFDPPSANLDNLDHSKAYAWGLIPNIPAGEVVISAKLTISNIYDWQVEQNSLTVDLLNSPPAYGTSTTTGTASNYLVTKNDGQDGGSYWEHPGSWGGWKQMFVWSDTDGPATENELVYDFSNLYVYDQSGTHLLSAIPSTGASMTTLTDYLAGDGLIGIGFDPDCHYFNSKVELQITTSPKQDTSVPSPLAPIPFAVGLIVALRRRRR